MLPFERQGRLHSLYYMLRSVAAVFEEAINQNEQILAGKEVRVLTASTGGSGELHLALGAVTHLYREAAKDTLIGWVGPSTETACPPTQDVIHGLGQPQISYGCTRMDMSNKNRFPVRA